MASCSFWALCKAVGAFFRSGTVTHLQTTHFRTNLHVPGMRLLSQIQLNQTSPNGIFVLLSCLLYCILCGTRSSDVLTLPTTEPSHQNSDHSLINTENCAALHNGQKPCVAVAQPLYHPKGHYTSQSEGHCTMTRDSRDLVKGR
jgi:hypothetical protein